MELMKKTRETGQALLVVVLIFAVALTMGLAIVSRSVTDIRISKEQEESARAFSAAEAGIEAALGGEEITSFGDFNLDVDTWTLAGFEQTSFVYPDLIKKGETQTVWLVGHNEETSEPDPSVRFNGNEITIFWGNEGTPINDDAPALEATLYFQDGDKFKTKKYTADPKLDRASSNDFSVCDETEGYTLEDKNFQFRKTLTDLPPDMYFLRLKLIYNQDSHLLGVQTDEPLPTQGKCYEATASQAETGISSKVKQCNLHQAPPSIFDYVLYSEQDLRKE